MNLTIASFMLAAVPEEGGYINLVKVGVVIVLLLLWAAALQWVDRDTNFVKTKREHWNLITISGGVVGFIALFVPPWSGPLLFVGLFVWFLLAGGALLAYVTHRNGRVTPNARILTPAHFKRLFSGGENKRRTVKDKGQRVRITDHKGENVTLPEDQEEALDYQAAQDFLFDMLWRRASDADMLAGKERYRLVYRIDGAATEDDKGIATEDGERIFRCLKRVGGLNVEEIRRPQTGRFRAALLSQTEDPGPTQVHTSGTTAGERLRLHFQHGPILLRVNELGMAPSREAALRKLLTQPTGLILIGAPPHNGLTTTEYALLRAHDAYMQNIHKVSLELDNITQRVYDANKAEVSFARTLQSVLRREPDVVLVGECEDRETAQVAARAAAEDRKIYLGAHAKDSFEALSRFLAFVENNRLVAKALLSGGVQTRPGDLEEAESASRQDRPIPPPADGTNCGQEGP